MRRLRALLLAQGRRCRHGRKDEGTGIAKRQAKIERDLLEKENEGKLRVYNFRISALEETSPA